MLADSGSREPKSGFMGASIGLVFFFGSISIRLWWIGGTHSSLTLL